MKKIVKGIDPPNIFHKIPVIRTDDTEAGIEQSKAINVEKKKFNIPVGDVTVDDDYEKNVPATYILPTSYVRYVKRIGIDDDTTVDYNIEDEDLKWLRTHSTLSVDKDSIKYLTVDTFEQIFNMFERSTGYSTTVVPKNSAEKTIGEKLKWPSNIVTKIVTPLYQYWLSKRNKLNKPLCRKFWPPTLTTDTNPHHVFRPRDKERYRLRKQQRKNDLESFRKMQTLRYEFLRAKNLMQLVYERELLKEAELKIQHEIFEQSIHDHISPNTTRNAIPFQHKLQFPHLLKDPEKEQKVVIPQESLKLKLVLSKTDSTIDPQKIKKPKKKKETTATDDILVDLSADIDTATVEEKKETIMIYETLPGPKYICRPSWPSFMSNLPTRDKLNVQMNLTDYIDELDIRPDEKPKKFLCKGRIGRGGRIVIDRIPVYDKPDENWDPIHSSYSSRQTFDHTYIYPTTLSNYPPDQSGPSLQHTSSVSLQTKSSPILEVSSVSQSHIPFYAYTKSRFLPSAYPPVYIPFTATLAAREREIYNCSDSEDERVELYDKTTKNSSNIKYTMRN